MNHQPALSDVLGEITPYGEDFVASFVNAPMTFLLLISEIKMGGREEMSLFQPKARHTPQPQRTRVLSPGEQTYTW